MLQSKKNKTKNNLITLENSLEYKILLIKSSQNAFKILLYVWYYRKSNLV